jgi:hypothetical protein
MRQPGSNHTALHACSILSSSKNVIALIEVMGTFQAMNVSYYLISDNLY